jgi:hypothetical protein
VPKEGRPWDGVGGTLYGPQNFKEVQMACSDIMFDLQHMANPRGYTCEAALMFKAVQKRWGGAYLHEYAAKATPKV